MVGFDIIEIRYETIGKPLDNCAVYLLDSSKQLVEAGEIGEIYVAGSHVCSGYVRHREMERFVTNTVEDTPGVFMPPC